MPLGEMPSICSSGWHLVAASTHALRGSWALTEWTLTL